MSTKEKNNIEQFQSILTNSFSQKEEKKKKEIKGFLLLTISMILANCSLIISILTVNIESKNHNHNLSHNQNGNLIIQKTSQPSVMDIEKGHVSIQKGHVNLIKNKIEVTDDNGKVVFEGNKDFFN